MAPNFEVIQGFQQLRFVIEGQFPEGLEPIPAQGLRDRLFFAHQVELGLAVQAGRGKVAGADHGHLGEQVSFGVQEGLEDAHVDQIAAQEGDQGIDEGGVGGIEGERLDIPLELAPVVAPQVDSIFAVLLQLGFFA